MRAAGQQSFPESHFANKVKQAKPYEYNTREVNNILQTLGHTDSKSERMMFMHKEDSCV